MNHCHLVLAVIAYIIYIAYRHIYLLPKHHCCRCHSSNRGKGFPSIICGSWAGLVLM